MSLWISSLKQLEPARHLFTPLLWDFMEAAWPSPISLVVPRGEETLVLPSSLESFGFETPTLSPATPHAPWWYLMVVRPWCLGGRTTFSAV